MHHRDVNAFSHHHSSFTHLTIIPAANAPSESNIGSYESHCSRGYQGSFPSKYSFCNKVKVKDNKIVSLD
jgi:hypothetical protein